MLLRTDVLRRQVSKCTFQQSGRMWKRKKKKKKKAQTHAIIHTYIHTYIYMGIHQRDLRPVEFCFGSKRWRSWVTNRAPKCFRQSCVALWPACVACIISLGLSGDDRHWCVKTGARQAEINQQNIYHEAEKKIPPAMQLFSSSCAQSKGDMMLNSHYMPIKLFGPTCICTSWHTSQRTTHGVLDLPPPHVDQPPPQVAHVSFLPTCISVSWVEVMSSCSISGWQETISVIMRDAGPRSHTHTAGWRWRRGGQKVMWRQSRATGLRPTSGTGLPAA